jgi:hypothetical protein
LSGQDGSVLHEVTRDERADYNNLFGYAVSGAGDVDGDGYGDFVVGDPGWVHKHGMGNGRVQVYSGRDGNEMIVRRGEDYGGAGFRLDGFGCAVSSAGDVNADGHADIIVGANRGLTTGFGFVYSGERGVMVWGVEAHTADKVDVRPPLSWYPDNR